MRVAVVSMLAISIAGGCGDQNTGRPVGAISASDGSTKPRLEVGTYDGTWRDVTPEGAGVTVSMPGTPGPNPWTFDSGAVKIPEVAYMLVSPDGKLTYTIAVSQFPAAALADLPLEARLRSGAEHFTPFEAPDRVKLVFTESIVGELPALDAVAVSKGGMWSHVRTFFVGTREIGLIVTAPEDRKDAPELARFLASARVAR